MERYNLPEGWELKRIVEIAEIVSGATPKTRNKSYWNGNIPWATPKDLGQLTTIEISSTERQITKEGYESCSTKLLPAGSVLLSSRAPIGHLAINTVPMCTNQGFKSLIPNKRIFNRYLYWLLKSKVADLQHVGRGCTFGELSKDIVESFEVPIPSLEEQRRIVEQIEGLAIRIDKIRHLRSEAIKQTSLQSFHVRRKIFEDILAESESKPLSKCGKVLGGGTPSKKREDYWNGDIPWISAKEMKHFKLTDSVLKITNKGLNESSAKMIPAGSVLFVVRGSILYRYVPVAVNTMPCTINQDMKAIIPKEGIDAEYIAHILIGANDILRNMVEEAGNTAGKLQTPLWSAFEIPIPSLERQRKIVKWLNEYEEKLALLQQLQSETESEIAKFTPALLSKAFQGEL